MIMVLILLDHTFIEQKKKNSMFACINCVQNLKLECGLWMLTLLVQLDGDVLKWVLAEK